MQIITILASLKISLKQAVSHFLILLSGQNPLLQPAKQFLEECSLAEVWKCWLWWWPKQKNLWLPCTAIPTLPNKYTHRCELTMESKGQGRKRSPDPQNGSTGHNH